jgi:hypothetical protein
MTELEQFLVALVGEIAADLAPIVEKLVEGAIAGKTPVEVLADENVVAVVPDRWRLALVIASQREVYGQEKPQ